MYIMRIRQSSDSIQADNEIIGYVDGYTVIKNEWGSLFVVEQPEEAGAIGEVVESKYLISLEQLPDKEQSKIKKAVL